MTQDRWWIILNCWTMGVGLYNLPHDVGTGAFYIILFSTLGLIIAVWR